MNYWTWTLVAVVCASLYYYIKKKHNYFREFGIPNKPPFPIFGNTVNLLFLRKHIHDEFCDIYNYNRDAKYVGAYDFMKPAIMLRDLDLIKEVTIKHFDNFPNHQLFIDDTVDPLFGGNLFTMADDRWREARTMLSPAFTSSKMRAMFELMLECGKNFVNHVHELPASETKMVSTKELFTKYTNDVIATCAFGIGIDSLKNPENDFYVLGKEATNLNNWQTTLKFIIASISPKLVKMLRLSFVNERVRAFFDDIVRTTVQTRDEKGITRPDMIQLMMDARGKESKHLKLDITEITAQAFIFFFGGFESTSNQMCLIAHELAINPDVQKKLQNEIDEVMEKSNGNPTYEDINSMPYLDAVFYESLRLHTQNSFLDRLCKTAFELPPAVPGAKPFTVKPGMNIWIPASAIHRDSKYYDNPNKFDPDRYYEKKVTINDALNLGFGIGPRSCIGNRFAILETKILIFLLLSRFNLKANEKTCNPLIYGISTFGLVAKGGFWLSIEHRN